MVLGRYTTNKGGSSSNTVLAARTNEPCTNPNCKAKKPSTHTLANCYWPGGGKEGQFPPGFGQRARANATTSTPMTAVSNTPRPPLYQLPPKLITLCYPYKSQTLDNPGC